VILLDPAARPIVGHRGASGICPENTLLAFREALAMGADALEFDVRLSRDGVAVLMHDASVDRTTNGRGLVADRDLKDLQCLDAGRGEPVPTLDGVLEEFRRVPLIVEVKEARAAAAVVTALQRHAASGRVLVGSFVARALVPFGVRDFHRSASRRETARAWLASRVGIGMAGPYRAFTVPERHGRRTIVDARFVAAAERRGRPVHVWTVDDPHQACRLRALGVCGIITNVPDRMRTLES
jgi:glycerophosphoryl diester phosphodiesterase